MKPAVIPTSRPLPELLPIDDLDLAIVTLSARINAETYELLVLIREFDERAGWHSQRRRTVVVCVQDNDGTR